MEGHCSTGQSPQWAVVPMEEEEEEGDRESWWQIGKKMEGHCSTGQSPQWAVVPVEVEEITHNYTD